MATTITMPKLGLTMNSGSVQQWKKKVGDPVKKGEVLYVVATDKLAVDVESPADGVLLAITIQEGEEVPVGASIGVIGAPGEQVGTGAPVKKTPEPGLPYCQEDRREDRKDEGVKRRGAEVPPCSPKAKKLARENGVDLSTLRGTGPGGWIVASDVLLILNREGETPRAGVRMSPVAGKMAAEAGIDPQAAAPGQRVMKADVSAALLRAAGRRVPVTQMRRVIGERMLLSVSTIPAVSYFADADMGALNDLRAALNARSEKTNVKISVNDILMKFCAKLLSENPMANASVETDATGRTTAFVLHDSVNVGIAVALEGGLVVPNVKDVQIKSLTRIAKERGALVDRARNGGLTPDDTTGGTFTISNLGSVAGGIDSFTPIINPPEAAILGVGTTRDRAVVRDGVVTVRPVSTLCLVADHRLVDGADAAALLAKLKELIENPDLFLL
ncbi:MAG: 2-oxo acid dehydrogenase subunit E2 [Synergistaceae bacterium]|jgi:pyruvate dehydrogenase E2 component (dihydrolipoamide acetyltransferase)|nr:2-oxo acid dehydrogenase subunit E2 [Synergistaceae bacterium]